MRATIRFFPQGLSLWCLEDSVGGLHRDVLQRAAMTGASPARFGGSACWILAVASALLKSESTR